MRDLSRKKISQKIEYAATYITLIYYIGPNVSNIVTKAWTLLTFTVVAFLFFKRHNKFVYVATRDFLLIFIVGLAFFSALWSIEPTTTLAYGRSLLFSTGFGVCLATKYTLREQVKLICNVLALVTILNLLIPVLFPSYGIGSDSFITGEAWRGIHKHKNELSGAMSIGTILFLMLTLYSSELKQRLATFLGSVCGFCALILSQGMGSLGIFVGSLLLIPLYKIVRQEYRIKLLILIVFLTVLTIVSIATVFNFEFIVVDLLGKDTNLNSRGPLWSLLITLGQEKPWLGYGYGGFWIDLSTARNVAVEFPWIGGAGEGGGNAHNGYIEIFLQLGWIGLLSMSVHILLTLARVIFVLSMKKKLEYAWLLLLVFIMTATSSYESYGSFLTYRHWYWVLYVSGSYSLLIEQRNMMSCIEK